jgi:tetratricopeptide (TPR) repeat protein
MRTVREITQDAFDRHRSGDLAGAESIYDQLLSQLSQPDPNVLYGYGTLLATQQRYGLAITLLQGSLGLYRDHAPTWTNLACAYKFAGRDEEALRAYETALSLEPHAPDILAGIAGFWINKAEARRVEDYARRALTIDPSHDAAHMHLALGLLEQGRFEEAWSHYEHRWNTLERKNDRRPYKASKWTGEPVGTLAIHGEQGLGDEILFMSAFKMARSRAQRIVVECAPRLLPLFERSFDATCYGTHVELIEAEGEPDAWISMGDLFGVVGMGDGSPYLARTERTKSHRIGIAWKGGTARTNKSDRTLELSDFAPILSTPGIEFVSVQYGDDAEAAELGVRPLGNADFDAIQARIESCELVISVCQTAVHQAGAMGVPCWVLTPKHAAWRYCGETMPWYNSVRLYRQTGEWSDVIEGIATDLRKLHVAAA